MAGIYPKPIILPQQTTPANPPANSLAIYPKSDGKFYQLDSAGVESLLVPAGIGPQLVLVYKVATADKTFVKANYPGLSAIRVRVQGGGGGGAGVLGASSQAGAGAGGSGGGYAESLFSDLTDLPETVTVVVGSGGAAGTSSSTAGSAGGESYFMNSGAFAVRAPGGNGAVASSTSATLPRVVGGTVASGTNFNGEIVKRGSFASPGILCSTINGQAGSGGDSFLGTGGLGPSYATAGALAGTAGGTYGGGGSGAIVLNSTLGRSGGDGAPGVVIVELYMIDPNV